MARVKRGVTAHKRHKRLLDDAEGRRAREGVEDISLGMAHRGRLNVLANIVGKNLQQIFTEFDEAWTAAFATGGGDVKYHMGYSNECPTSTGQKLRVVLAASG